ncbi:HsdM family class I SAM-dependent methyltransferase [Candidatus Clostridium radicumherbarum]|uniref:site-specific DNA-methyltransferase (adenine-specific) n=1 Tax=Candidatus Clostridium radicumherbarum TaxID=3381662 RepID=A0ABW8TU91_9CLOT
MAHIDEIIKQMGYAESSCLKYKHDNFSDALLSAHTAKVLDELSPYAIYLIDDNPFVLFFEEHPNQDESKQLNRKIWNAQIPIVIVCGTSDVKIYNGCFIDREECILEQVGSIAADTIDENSPFSYWDITNQNFWGKYDRQFSGEKLNDCLLSNLADITEKLRNLYHVSFATKLMLRLIFIRYLIDRGVDLDYIGFSSDVQVSRNSFLELLDHKENLYALFSHLKEKFNGNLFELNNEIYDSSLTVDVLQVLRDFLSANIDTKTGQLSFFDLYDFNIIPVELISNIYEILLGQEKRDKDNAFYTPQYLVDYILDHSISQFVRDNGKCKVLDPSCGSGIFLVESYRRMVEKELNGAQFTDDNEVLQRILTENIYGVDLNPDAIDVAIFSLYLAVLDYKNPKTLNKFVLPNLKGKNLFAKDFFDEDALSSLQTVAFDFIVGNPPWGKGNQLQTDYCTKRNYKKYMQNSDTCRGFILRSKDFSSANTQCCFVLHSKLLYMQKQPSKSFRGYLLNNTEIMRIVELSSVRKLVFKNADAPAVVLSYRFSDKNVLENRFEYISMKPNIFFRLFNIIVVEKNDVKQIKQRLLAENDWVWKTLVYGLTGDIDNILRIKNEYKTLGDAISEQSPKLIVGTGMKYSAKDSNGKVNKKDASHLIGRSFLESTAIDHFQIDLSRLTSFNQRKVESIRNEKLYEAPYCLVRRGLDMSDYTMRAVYSETSFIFREAFYAIKGSVEQKTQLLNIVGLLNSNAYAYFNLMLNSSLGVEREQRQMDEILLFPYIYADDIAQLVEKIQNANNTNNELSISKDTSCDMEELKYLILKAFHLLDNEFVDYALSIQIPQLTQSNDHNIYRDAEIKDFELYAKPFYDYLAAVFATSKKHILINVYQKIAKHYSAVEVVLQDEKPQKWFQVINDRDSSKEASTKFSAYKINDLFFELKDVINFEENSFYIVKPNHYKNWHPAIAQLDLMEAVNQILSRNGGDI